MFVERVRERKNVCKAYTNQATILISSLPPAILFSSFHPCASFDFWSFIVIPGVKSPTSKQVYEWTNSAFEFPSEIFVALFCVILVASSFHPFILRINKWIQLFIWKTRASERRCWFLFVCHFSNQHRNECEKLSEKMLSSWQKSSLDTKICIFVASCLFLSFESQQDSHRKE